MRAALSMSSGSYSSHEATPFALCNDGVYGGEVLCLAYKKDVHDLITTAADAIAEKQWELAGARSRREMRGFLISRCRRRVGLAVVQAMARHRLARVPYIGVPYVAVRTRAQQLAGAAGQYAPSPG